MALGAVSPCWEGQRGRPRVPVGAEQAPLRSSDALKLDSRAPALMCLELSAEKQKLPPGIFSSRGSAFPELKGLAR